MCESKIMNFTFRAKIGKNKISVYRIKGDEVVHSIIRCDRPVYPNKFDYMCRLLAYNVRDDNQKYVIQSCVSCGCEIFLTMKNVGFRKTMLVVKCGCQGCPAYGFA
jgi:hypothetical protein